MAAPIGRVQAIMTGFQGAPGLLQFYWNGSAAGSFTNADATTAVAAVRALIAGSASAFSVSVSIAVQPAVEVVEATTGALISVATATPVAVVGGSSTGNIIVAQGPLYQWYTALVVGRRILRGRTFCVPTGSSAVSTLGQVSPTVQTSMLTAGSVYLSSGPAGPVIWHRPVPFRTGTNGVASPITAVTVPLKMAVLRSRRD